MCRTPGGLKSCGFLSSYKPIWMIFWTITKLTIRKRLKNSHQITYLLMLYQGKGTGGNEQSLCGVRHMALDDPGQA